MGSPAAHVVAVVAAPIVVGDQPGVGGGLELSAADETPAGEGRPPAFLEDGAVEAFDHGVVVGRAGRDAHVADLLGGQRGPEVGGDVLGTVVGDHGSQLVAVTAPVANQLVHEAARGRPRGGVDDN